MELLDIWRKNSSYGLCSSSNGLQKQKGADAPFIFVLRQILFRQAVLPERHPLGIQLNIPRENLGDLVAG